MGHAKTVNVWRCDNCGKEEQWGPGWRSRLILHKSGGPGPWDEELVACSDACATAIDEKRKWKKLPDKSKGEPAVEICGGQLQPVHNAELRGRPLNEQRMDNHGTQTAPMAGGPSSNDVLGAFMQPRALIDLTDDQLDQLAPLFLKLKEGGAIWGQIWGDGMHVKVISPEDVTKVQAALGRQENRTWGTAVAAYEAGLQEDAPNA